MSKPIATDEFMRLNGRSIWVAGEAEGEGAEPSKAARRLQSDSDEEEIQDSD